MTLLSYKIFTALAILLVTLLSVIYPIYARTSAKQHLHALDLGDAFASGVFLGAALFHLLPEAIHYFHANSPYPVAEWLTASGFLLLLFLERLSLHSHHERITSIPYILALVIMVHSLIEGTVIGVNTEISALSIISLAVLAHKSSESFALSAILVKSQMNWRPLLLLLGIFAFMTPLGILLGSFVTPLFHTQAAPLTAGFDAFAAGTFLYMSTLHHVSHHQRLHEAESLTEFFCLFLGVVIMAALA